MMNSFVLVFGALSAQYFSDRYGRRSTFFVAAFGFIIGTSVMAASSAYTTLIIGRTLIGLGVGVGLAVSLNCLSELGH
jgi:predicted MFS family arabinose efflux permease